MKANRILVFTLSTGLTALAACGGESKVAEAPPPVSAPEGQAQQQPEPQPVAVESPTLFVSGEVKEVNPEAMLVVLTDTKGLEQTFKFSDLTSITGAADVKTLPAQEGRPATIRYIENAGGKSATQIHIEVGS